MSRSSWFIALAVTTLLASHVPGCGRPDARHYPRAVGGTSPDAGKASGTGGMEAEPTGGTGGSATGGRPGTGGTPETGGTGGGAMTGTGGVFGDEPDAAIATGGAGGSLAPDAALSPDLPGTGGVVLAPDAAPDLAATGGQGGRDAGLPGNGTTAYCHPDPNVIAICKQLEPACLNCPSNSSGCFTVAEAGDDKACARYAVDKKCTVDVGGNWCGSLNCNYQGCDKAACTKAQGDGASAECQKLLAKCPCK